MKLSPRSLVVWFVCTLFSSPVVALDRLPVEDFARDPDSNRLRLSPDGNAVAFMRNYNGVQTLHISDVATGRMTRVNVGQGIDNVPGLNGHKRVVGYSWVGKDRLMVTTAVGDSLFGVFAVNRDGSRSKGLGGYEKDRINLHGEYIQNVVLYTFDEPEPSVLLLDRSHAPNRPELVRMNTVTGSSSTVVKNPGEVAYWGVDFQGVARFGILTHGDLSGAIYRDGEKSDWKTILPLQNRRGQLRVVGFDAAANRILVAMLNDEHRWAVYPLDAATGAFGAALLSDSAYDIVSDHGIAGAAGIELAGTFFSQSKQALAGIRYYTEAPRVKWFDRDYALRQAGIDHSLPNTVNVLVEESRDGKKELWFSFSDQDPGAYHLLDVERKTFQPIAPRMDWIKPAQMATMLSVKYAARDGLEIHGYLTIPVGSKPERLPLVVMPHGGPWVRDVWGFDPLVQLLANRGYAVLQMNYRGSTGYGDELLQQAKREIGAKIQDDIEDGTRWAIAAGIADPGHIAIMGSSYGGYSALFALGHNPELYRCGISIAGVTDWPAIYEDSDVANNKLARNHWREQIGDPSRDAVRLAAISPVNFADKIVAPVLIIQGKDDQRVPPDQAKRMIAALTKVGRPPESLLVPDLGHEPGNEKQRLKIYQQVVDFLEKNLGPGGS